MDKGVQSSTERINAGKGMELKNHGQSHHYFPAVGPSRQDF
jgi:hypothetical protein